MAKNLPSMQETWVYLTPGSGRSHGEGNGYPLQYSSLEVSMDKGACWAILHRVIRVRHDWVTNTTTTKLLVRRIEARTKLFGWTLLLLLLSHFSRVQLCATPSLGFSRQEHWSGLPFPSPRRESEVAQLCPTLSDLMDCSLSGSSIHGIFQSRVLEWGVIAFSLDEP